MTIIKAENVSIRYITGDLKKTGFKEYVMLKLRGKYRVKEFWADKDINFELEKGDMLGIIGTNGAGKSTLLKAISGIMKPTRGRMIINGSVAALLELASGFDGELTVRENTYLRGAMLGYTRRFMDEKYNEIVEFAELEEFQDRPFKQLSSGMKSRLAFSIACLVEPDILILDEVLSVGDGAFRKKSGDKMKKILSGGVTGILVSHSLDQVRELCNKILWLDHGRQIEFTDDVIGCCNRYEQLTFKNLKPDVKKIKHTIFEDANRKILRKEHSTQKLESNQIIELQNKVLISWKEIFKNIIRSTSWIKEDVFDSGITMVGYRYLCIMSKLLSLTKPCTILELGLFVSSSLTCQYDSAFPVLEHIIVEENKNKIRAQKEALSCNKDIEIIHLPSKFEIYKDDKVRVYDGFEQLLQDKHFSFISIKAPAGGDMKEYSRIDILPLLPHILEEKFVIMIGDVDRKGEANTVKEIQFILEKNLIEFEIRKYYGDKDFVVIASTGVGIENID